MPDLTFSEIALERSVLGKSKSSETWLDGVVVSSAEATRQRVPNVTKSQAEAVAEAAAARGKSQFNAGHWYHQPVGGRAVCTRPLAASLNRRTDGWLACMALSKKKPWPWRGGWGRVGRPQREAIGPSMRPAPLARPRRRRRDEWWALRGLLLLLRRLWPLPMSRAGGTPAGGVRAPTGGGVACLA